MFSSQDEQAERRRALDNDRKVQGTTMHAFTQADAEIPRGRFGLAQPSPYVVGSTAVPIYPAAALQHDPVGLEPPLSYRVDELPEPEPAPPSSVAAPATDGLPAPSTPASMSDAGRLSFSHLRRRRL
jgi:hypothetical protein